MPPRRVTTAETLQFLQACNTQVKGAWRHIWSRCEGRAGRVRLIKDGPLFQTLAHTEAERRNSDARLLQEFQLQVAKAGHVVQVDGYDEPEKKGKRQNGLTEEALQILRARTIDAQDFKALKRLCNLKKDRGTQLHEVTKYEACAFYGLKDLSEFFFVETKAEYKPPFSRQLEILLKVLLPGRFFDEQAVARQSHKPAKVDFARKLIKVLGLAHPLDGSFTPSLIAGGLKKKLLKTELYPKPPGAKTALSERVVSEMFQFQLPRPHDQAIGLLPGQFKKVLDGVLGCMGLKVEMTEVSRPR